MWDKERVTSIISSVYLDLARAVTQGSSLAGSEHGDHLIQASLQGTKHLSPSLLLPAVSCNSHVQRPRPGVQTVARLLTLMGHLIKLLYANPV